jgi:hypothetical protein
MPKITATRSIVGAVTLASITALSLLLVGCATSRAGYATAPYASLDEDEAFSTRRYDPMVLATTPLATSEKGDRNGSFMRLFRYISGANEVDTKVSMTTPVYMAGSGTSGTMSFVLPEEHVEAPPKPTNKNVSLRKVPAYHAAVVRFNGRAKAKSIKEQTAKLRAWMKDNALISTGEPLVAQYDPPWTLGPMRKNEIIIPIAPVQKSE